MKLNGKIDETTFFGDEFFGWFSLGSGTSSMLESLLVSGWGGLSNSLTSSSAQSKSSL